MHLSSFPDTPRHFLYSVYRCGWRQLVGKIVSFCQLPLLCIDEAGYERREQRIDNFVYAHGGEKPSKGEYPEGDSDAITMFCVLLPGIFGVFGIILLSVGLLLHAGQYFEGCGRKGDWGGV